MLRNMSKYFVMLDDNNYQQWDDLGTAIKLLHTAEVSEIKTVGGGVISNETWEKMLSDEDLSANLHKLILQYRQGALSLNDLEIKIRNSFGEVGFGRAIEKALIDGYGLLKKKYNTKTYKAQLVICNVNQGNVFSRNNWPLTGESALAWGVRELWIQGIMFWISHHFCDTGVVKFPQMAVYVSPLVKVKSSGTLELHPSKGKPWLLLRTYAGLYDQALEGKVTPDEIVINKFSEEISLSLDGKMPYIIDWDEDEVFLKSRKANDEGSLISDEMIMKIVSVLRSIESKTLYPVSISWQIFGKEIVVSTILRHDQENTTVLKHTGLNVLAHGKAVVGGIVSGEFAVINEKISGTSQRLVVYLDRWKEAYLNQMINAKGVIIGNVGFHEKLMIESILREHGIVSCEANLSHVTKLPKTVTLDGKTGLIYEGNLLHRLDSKHKVIAREEKVEIPSIVKKTTATHVYFNLEEISSALPDLDGVSGLIVSAEYLWRKINTHPEYLKEHNKLHLITDELVEKLTRLCLENSNLKIIFKTTSLTRNELLKMKFGKAYESDASSKNVNQSEYIHQHTMFDCEIEVVKNVRHKNRITNLSIEICGAKDLITLLEMKKHLSGKGLIRSASFNLWVGISTPLMVDYVEELSALGVDGIVIETERLLELYAGRQNEELDQMAIKWLVKIIENSKKMKLPHIFGINTKWRDIDLKELMTQGLTSVNFDLSEEKRGREEIWKSEQLLIKKS